VSGVDPRLASVELLAAVALFLLVFAPWRGARAGRDDTLAMLANVDLVIEDSGTVRTIRAPLPISIGRAPTATVVVADPQVSRLHARIDAAGDVLEIRDLGSRNGTFVNAQPIDGPTALVAGDEIALGMTRVVFRGVLAGTRTT
jgi:pSer/pThr/pTyr-binding forkhead associated (FHA) protein